MALRFSVGARICVGAFLLPPMVLAAPKREDPKPVVRIDLEAVGYRPVSARVAMTDASLLTVNFVDDHHLLVTFVSRNLIPRISEPGRADRDRLIHAAYFDLPSGNLVTQTEWRMHDRGRYLWPLADGRFLLRSQDTLYTLSPLLNSGGGQLDKSPLMDTGGEEIRALDVSPDGTLVSLQTSAPRGAADDPVARPQRDVHFKLYELKGSNMTELGHADLHGGVITSPVHKEGFLEVKAENRAFWAFDLRGFRSGRKELAAVETSCRPYATFLSHGEFLVSGCRGGEEHTMMGVLDMEGEVKWLGPAPQEAWVAMQSAPRAERFAIRETLGVAGYADVSEVQDVHGQRVAVYRTYTGEKIFEVNAGTVMRAGQNFAISSDGADLAVWAAGSVEIYKLPPVTDKDRAMAKRSAEPVKLDEK